MLRPMFLRQFQGMRSLVGLSRIPAISVRLLLLVVLPVAAVAFLPRAAFPASSARPPLEAAPGASSIATPTEIPPAPTASPTPLPTATPTPEPTPIPTPAVPPQPAEPGEHWIDVNLTNQTITAMLDDKPYYTALATSGAPGWETPEGEFKIVYRVYNETMTSAALGIPPGPDSYDLKDVMFTQYFTTVGHAIHLNYWRPAHVFGHEATSHGCVGLRYADAEFFWRFATVGTRVVVHR